MGRPMKLLDEDKEEIVRLRIKGYSYKELAEAFNCSHPVINRVLRKANLVKNRGVHSMPATEDVRPLTVYEDVQVQLQVIESFPVDEETLNQLFELIEDQSTTEDW